MKNSQSSKLWKQVGLTHRKYQKSIERAPSFQRSDLGKSVQRENSLSSSSNNFRKNMRVKTQTTAVKNQFSQNSGSNLSRQLMQLSGLKAVPEQDDVRGSSMTFKNCNWQSKQNPCKNSQLQLFNEIFFKKQKKNQHNSSIKQKFQLLNFKIEDLSYSRSQYERMVKLSLCNFKNQIRRYERKIREAMLKLTTQLFQKNNEIAHLRVENNDLRNQMLQYYNMIDNMQKTNHKTLNTQRSRIDQELNKRILEKSNYQNMDKTSYPNMEKSNYQNMEQSKYRNMEQSGYQNMEGSKYHNMDKSYKINLISINDGQQTIKKAQRPLRNAIRRLYSLTDSKQAQSIEKVVIIQKSDAQSISITEKSNGLFAPLQIKKINSKNYETCLPIPQSPQRLVATRKVHDNNSNQPQNLKDLDKRQKFKKFIAERQVRRNQVKNKVKIQENGLNGIPDIKFYRGSNLNQMKHPRLLKKQSTNSNPEPNLQMLTSQKFVKNQQDDMTNTVNVAAQRNRKGNNSTYTSIKRQLF